MGEKKSILFLKNAYCCGHGEIVHRLENWCLANKVEYQMKKSTDTSMATYNGKSVELNPNLTLSQVLAQLGLESSLS